MFFLVFFPHFHMYFNWLGVLAGFTVLDFCSVCSGYAGLGRKGSRCSMKAQTTLFPPSLLEANHGVSGLDGISDPFCFLSAVVSEVYG